MGGETRHRRDPMTLYTSAHARTRRTGMHRQATWWDIVKERLHAAIRTTR